MIGLALMAMRLAELRTGGNLSDNKPVSRKLANSRYGSDMLNFPASHEYYRIIDQIDWFLKKSGIEPQLLFITFS